MYTITKTVTLLRRLLLLDTTSFTHKSPDLSPSGVEFTYVVPTSDVNILSTLVLRVLTT
jgi:hypothetical protein